MRTELTASAGTPASCHSRTLLAFQAARMSLSIWVLGRYGTMRQGLSQSTAAAQRSAGNGSTQTPASPRGPGDAIARRGTRTAPVGMGGGGRRRAAPAVRGEGWVGGHPPASSHGVVWLDVVVALVPFPLLV